MICLSHSGTLRLIDRLSKEHDIKVQFWCDSLVEHLKVYNNLLSMDYVLFRNVKGMRTLLVFQLYLQEKRKSVNQLWKKVLLMMSGNLMTES